MKFGLDFIRKLKPTRYFLQAPMNDGREHFGFVAQDVDEIAHRHDYGFVGYEGQFLSLNYIEFIAPIVKSIQELDKEILELKRQVKKLEKRINSMKPRYQ